MDIVVNKKTEAEIVERVVAQVQKSLAPFLDRPSRTRWLLAGAALGALGVIFLDPTHGAKRRAKVRDTVQEVQDSVSDFTGHH